MVLPKLKFKRQERANSVFNFKRKTIKVYPYAKLAAERLEALQKRLETLKVNDRKRNMLKLFRNILKMSFLQELKKLTKTEGQILVKLIHSQTGKTTFNLIKELRSGWRAFWFNSTASLFDISLNVNSSY